MMRAGSAPTLAVVIGLVLTTSCGQAASGNIASTDVEGIRRECQEFCALICDRAADGSALSLWSIYVEMYFSRTCLEFISTSAGVVGRGDTMANSAAAV
jgi:hypothetical protein